MKIFKKIFMAMIALGLMRSQSFAMSGVMGREGGGTNTMLPLLAKLSSPGNIATNWTLRECRIYLTGVDLIQDGSFLRSHPLVFNEAVSSTDQMMDLLEASKEGTLIPNQTPPDIGRYEYYGNSDDGQNSNEKVILLIENINGEKNTSSSAAALVNFIDLNCGFE